jgi:hypothetical protein
MSVTIANVRALLDVDEPNYAEAAKLGPKAVPHLETLVREGDAMLASKATYMASLIQSDHSINVVKAAAKSSDPVVRVAAAAAVRNLSAVATDEVLGLLSSDEDPGVRKTAFKASPAFASIPSPSAEGGPAPPESGGGSIGVQEGVPGSNSPSGDVVGDGGGSSYMWSADGSASSGAGDGGGTVDGTLPAGSTSSGEGGGG